MQNFVTAQNLKSKIFSHRGHREHREEIKIKRLLKDFLSSVTSVFSVARLIFYFFVAFP